MITTPSLRPNLLTKIETDFGSTISKSTWKKLIDFQMWMNRSLPIGMILSFYGSQTDVNNNIIQPPNPTNWQWCDGSIVSNLNSPLLNQNTPDFRGKFLKGFSNIGLTGGIVDINLNHNHGGMTGLETDRGVINADAGSDANNGDYHTHSISSGLNVNESFIPPHTELQYFIRVDGGNEYSHLTDPPSLVGEYLSEDDLKYGRIYSNEFATSLYTNSIILNSMIPIGMIVPIMTNISGVDSPDSNMWQECNGEEIINENSPLRTIGDIRNFTPNLLDSYIKVAPSFGLSGSEGGVNIFKFTHNHTGRTNNAPNNPDEIDQNYERNEAKLTHSHYIPNDLNEFDVQPPFYTVKFFIRIQ